MLSKKVNPLAQMNPRELLYFPDMRMIALRIS